jgi:ABC-type phosphate/phosphonate transport system substrate-binding protein
VNLDDVKTISLDAEVDSQGNPCASPEFVLRAIAAGRGDAGIITAGLWNRVKDKPEIKDSLDQVWTSPAFSHCVFTAAAKFDKDLAQRFTQLMTAMDPKDSSTSDVMRLEGTKKWLPGSPDGFEALVDALHRDYTQPAHNDLRPL